MIKIAISFLSAMEQGDNAFGCIRLSIHPSVCPLLVSCLMSRDFLMVKTNEREGTAWEGGRVNAQAFL